MNNDTAHMDQNASKGTPVLRIIVLGAFYALAVGFTVMLSPSMGVIRHQPTGETGNVASMEAPARR